MSIETNKEIVERFMRLFSEAQLEAAFELLADDMVWSLWGDGPGAGNYTKAGMKELLIQSWKWFNGPVLWIPTAFTAEGERVAVEAVSSAHTHGGYHHQGSYHNLFCVRGERITEIREMFLEGPVQALFKILQAEAASPIKSSAQ